jgi:hypothetical protein
LNASENGKLERAERLLEVIYSNDLQDSASPSKHPYYPMYLEESKSREAGKSITYIVENILKMGGHKFSEGTAGHNDTKS